MGIAAVGRGARAVGLQVGAWLTQEAIRLLVVAKGHRMRMLGNEGDLAPILLRADGLAALGAAAILSLQHGGALLGRQRAAAGHCAASANRGVSPPSTCATRRRMSARYSASFSQRIARKPSARQAMQVLPLPATGSSTRPPGGVTRRQR